eukprot:scaffold8_cov249-Pinguiococcus_pyrenoidosus.AAC.10
MASLEQYPCAIHDHQPRKHYPQSLSVRGFGLAAGTSAIAVGRIDRKTPFRLPRGTVAFGSPIL